MKKNKSNKKLVVILGARPNFVKGAPFFKRLEEYPEVTCDLIHTGQHYDANMSKIFFEDMGIPKPNFHFEFGAQTGTYSLGVLVNSLAETFVREQYDTVVVVGDTDSTLAGALAAKRVGCELVHIEAGLRSCDKRMPEEKNRIAIDHLSDRLFVTEEAGVVHLAEEGIADEKVYLVGNIMIESIERYRHLADESSVLSDLSLTSEAYFVVTIHRIENTSNDKIFSRILDTLQILAKKHTLVFPMHPGTKNRITALGFTDMLDNLKIVEPLGYLDFMQLVQKAKGVITDSGGIQEETSHLGIPCATIRDNTERPATLTMGTNKLFPLDSLDAGAVESHLLQENFKSGQIPLWDKDVSKRILDILVANN